MTSVKELISNNIKKGGTASNGWVLPVDVRICADGHNSTARGTVTAEAGTRILTYQDPGMDNSRTELRFAPESVQMKRTGDYSTAMCFALGKLFHGEYGTPFGRIGFRLRTQKLLCRETEQGWLLTLHYELHMDGSAPESHRLELTITGKSET